MPAREFRPATRVLAFVVAVSLSTLAWMLVSSRPSLPTLVFAVPYSLVFVALGVAATARVTVSESALEHRIAGRVRRWSLPDTRVELSELSWQRGQWRLVLSGPEGRGSVPLIGYSEGTARAIVAAVHERNGGAATA